MILNTENIILIGSFLLFFSIIAGKAGFRFGVPVLLLFLFVGMAFGSDGLGIQFNSAASAQFVGVIALSIILFSGGMDTNIKEIRPVAGKGIIMATLGVILTTILSGGFIYFIASLFGDNFSLSIMESLLLGAVMSSTDSASVFSILKGKNLKLKEKLRPMLELESGSNDPMAYMLTILLIQIIQSSSEEVGLISSIVKFFIQMGLGALAGYLFGKLAVWVMNRLNIDNQAMYPILLLSFIFFIFSFTDIIKGNGYLAVYIAGLVVGNRNVINKKTVSTFFDGLSWLAQIVMFLTLGLLVNPSDVIPVAGLGLLIGGFMIIVARPITTFLCMLPYRDMSIRAKLYVSWVGLRGAVPIIFATYPLIAEIPQAQLIFNVVFFITLLSLLVQGTTVGVMAKLLHLTDDDGDDKRNFGVELSDEIKSTMFEIRVTSEFFRNGNRIMDLAMPEKTLIVIVKREDHFFVPNGKTEMKEEDVLLIFTDNYEELLKNHNHLGIDNCTMLNY